MKLNKIEKDLLSEGRLARLAVSNCFTDYTPRRKKWLGLCYAMERRAIRRQKLIPTGYIAQRFHDL